MMAKKGITLKLSDMDFEVLNQLNIWAADTNNGHTESLDNQSALIRLAIQLTNEIVLKPYFESNGSLNKNALTRITSGVASQSESVNRELGMVKGLRDDIQELKVLMLNDFVMSHANDLGPGNRNFQIPAGLDNPVKEVNDLLTIRSEDYREYLIQKAQMALGDNL